MNCLTMPSFTIINKKKQKFTVLYDEEDTELLAQYTWHITHGYAATNGRRPDGSRFMLSIHRRIMEPPDGMQVDHRNGDKLDNRKANLRICTSAENTRNQNVSKANSSGFKGVYWSRNAKKFAAQIQFNGRLKYLGLFQTALEAARAYNKVATISFGEFAYLNDV